MIHNAPAGHAFDAYQHDWTNSSATSTSTPLLDVSSYQQVHQQATPAMFPLLDPFPTGHDKAASTELNAPTRSGSDGTGKRQTPSSEGDSPEEFQRVHKRQRNTEAARRYRQRKVDRVTELEEALRQMTAERDDLRLRLARSEASADVLRGMMEKRA